MNFFKQIGVEHRTRLVVVLDFQNLGVTARNITKMDDFIMEGVDRIAPQTDHEVFKAFARSDQDAAVSELRKLKWRVKADKANMDSAIIQQAKSDCGHDPEKTVLVICSKDRDFASLIQEMRDWGVEVYLMGPHDVSQRLKEAVGHGRWVVWPQSFPVVVQIPTIADYISGTSR